MQEPRARWLLNGMYYINTYVYKGIYNIYSMVNKTVSQKLKGGVNNMVNTKVVSPAVPSVPMLSYANSKGLMVATALPLLNVKNIKRAITGYCTIKGQSMVFKVNANGSIIPHHQAQAQAVYNLLNTAKGTNNGQALATANAEILALKNKLATLSPPVKA